MGTIDGIANKMCRLKAPPGVAVLQTVPRHPCRRVLASVKNVETEGRLGGL